MLALGSDSVFFGIPGVKEHCLPFCTYNDAVRVNFSLLTTGLVSHAPAIRWTTLCVSTAVRSVKLPVRLGQTERQLALLEQRPGLADVVVVGAGYAGIELATSVAERMQGRARMKVITAGRVTG